MTHAHDEDENELASTTSTTPDALPASKEAEAVTDAMVERAWKAYWADEFFGLPQDHSKRMRAALSTAMPAGDWVPPGMVPITECASDGCHKQATVRFERGGVGSYYCHDCYMRIQAIPASTAGDRK